MKTPRKRRKREGRRGSGRKKREAKSLI